MTPDLGRRLARAYVSVTMPKTGVADVAPVAVVAAVARYSQKPKQLQPLQPLQPKLVRRQQEDGAAVAAALDGVADAIEERKALLCCPEIYRDAFARLNHQKPFAVSAEEWERAVNDAGLFLDGWGALAADLEWTAGDLFDVPRADRAGGLIWRLEGELVEALGADHARLAYGRIIMRDQSE